MSAIPFGQHQGKDVEDINSSYLGWMQDQENFYENYPDLMEEIDTEMSWRTDHSEHFYKER